MFGNSIHNRLGNRPALVHQVVQGAAVHELQRDVHGAGAVVERAVEADQEPALVRGQRLELLHELHPLLFVVHVHELNRDADPRRHMQPQIDDPGRAAAQRADDFDLVQTPDLEELVPGLGNALHLHARRVLSLQSPRLLRNPLRRDHEALIRKGPVIAKHLPCRIRGPHARICPPRLALALPRLLLRLLLVPLRAGVVEIEVDHALRCKPKVVVVVLLERRKVVLLLLLLFLLHHQRGRLLRPLHLPHGAQRRHHHRRRLRAYRGLLQPHPAAVCLARPDPRGLRVVEQRRRPLPPQRLLRTGRGEPRGSLRDGVWEREHGHGHGREVRGGEGGRRGLRGEGEEFGVGGGAGCGVGGGGMAGENARREVGGVRVEAGAVAVQFVFGGGGARRGAAVVVGGVGEGGDFVGGVAAGDREELGGDAAGEAALVD
mmetsp:Transcript_1392/g.3867  ORF Transcript_1392/g.3867 Transcript_1392/m.3867 type:complete len:432 (+) Transcript_1392:595-1890(+)